MFSLKTLSCLRTILRQFLRCVGLVNHKVLENFQGLRILQTVRLMTSVNSVTATVHEATVKNSLLIEYRCQLQIYANVSLRVRYFYLYGK